MLELKLKRAGYVAKILTWHYGADEKGRNQYLAGMNNGCPMFWKFLFQFIWSFGGLRPAPVKRALSPERYIRSEKELADFVKPRRWEMTFQALMPAFSLLKMLFTYLFIIAILVTATAFGSLVGRDFLGEQSNFLFATAVGWLFFATLFGIMLLVTGVIVILANSEAFRLFISWAYTRKQKVCPVVTFE